MFGRLRMPSLGGATEWLNSEPLGPAQLQGNVALFTFWTLTCINWLRQGPALRELMSLLPSLRVVLLLGAKAVRGWERAAIEGDYAVLRAPHPSPRGTASRRGARDEIRDALIKARQLAGYT